MKDELFLDICKENFFALTQMLDETINLCPDDLWSNESLQPQYWQEVYHTIYYLDFYLGTDPKQRPERFDCKENLGEKPETILSKQDLKSYLKETKIKCQIVLDNLTSKEIEEIQGKDSYWWTGTTLGHRLVYTIRHSQHHIGKLNNILRNNGIPAAKWVVKAK